MPRITVAIFLALAVAGGQVTACDTAGRCVEGRAVGCACASGGTGSQSCLEDGTYGPCKCDGSPDAGGSDAAPGVDAGAADAATSDAHVSLFMGTTLPIPSRWEQGPEVGVAAGTELCISVFGPTADVCTYTDLLLANEAGELVGVPVNTTMWLHRLVIADLASVPTGPGEGGRCVDWTYMENSIADGEFVSFEQAGVPTFHLDNDTFYDGVDTTHTQPGLLECGNQTRTLPCCSTL